MTGSKTGKRSSEMQFGLKRFDYELSFECSKRINLTSVFISSKRPQTSAKLIPLISAKLLKVNSPFHDKRGGKRNGKRGEVVGNGEPQ